MARIREELQGKPANWAEWLLDLGKSVNKAIRHGAGIEEVAGGLQTTTDTCKLSLVFYRTSDLVKMRAMIEDWSRERMVMELGEIYSSVPTGLKASTR